MGQPVEVRVLSTAPFLLARSRHANPAREGFGSRMLLSPAPFLLARSRHANPAREGFGSRMLLSPAPFLLARSRHANPARGFRFENAPLTCTIFAGAQPPRQPCARVPVRECSSHLHHFCWRTAATPTLRAGSGSRMLLSPAPFFACAQPPRQPAARWFRFEDAPLTCTIFACAQPPRQPAARVPVRGFASHPHQNSQPPFAAFSF